MTQLLVSVRSAAEARSALAGGAGLIDVKEPAHGALGRAATRVIHEVVEAVGARLPVSAALGEWADDQRIIPDLALSFVKWGLARCARRQAWRRELAALLETSRRPQVVLAAYADWECAQAPPAEDVLALAAEHPGSVLLLDTHCKDANNPLRKARPTLLDWLPVAWVEDWCGRARDAGVRVALAGSLGAPEIRTLLPARPDWFAVRGAACMAGDRHGTITAEQVRRLADLIASPEMLGAS
jgi:uncharacterized protein (UPF0264 family)